MTIIQMQKSVCSEHNAVFTPSPSTMKLGIDASIETGARPINGLRHPPEGDTTGWYIYAGTTIDSDPDFFKPLHVEHVAEWCPAVQKYLGLPAGWRFLLDGDYEDVWFDASLLVVDQE